MERPFSRGAGPARADAAAEPDSARGASVVMSRLTQVPDESIQLTDLEKGEIYTTLASYQDEVEGKKTNVLNVRHDTSGRTYIIRTDDDVPPEKFTVISGRLFSCDESKGTVTPAKKVGS